MSAYSPLDAMYHMVATKAIPESEFKVPSGYKQVSFAELLEAQMEQNIAFHNYPVSNKKDVAI